MSRMYKAESVEVGFLRKNKDISGIFIPGIYSGRNIKNTGRSL